MTVKLKVRPVVPINDICLAIDRLQELGLQVSLAITIDLDALGQDALEDFVAEWERLLH